MRRDHPRLASQIDRALHAGTLQRVASGIYAPPGEISTALLGRAVAHLAPTAIITGRAAAALTWWPELPAPLVHIACAKHRTDAGVLRWERREVPAELVWERKGIRVTSPPLTVLDLLSELGGTVIDEALRRGAVRLEQVNAVFAGLPARRGDAERRRLLVDSRDEPWSEAERELQRRFRSLDCGYAHRTNHRVVLPDGSVRYFDLALPDLLLGFEADGYTYHGGRIPFVADRLSDAAAAALSWQRIRFAAVSVLAPDDTVTELMWAAITARAALLRGTRPVTGRVRRATRRTS